MLQSVYDQPDAGVVLTEQTDELAEECRYVGFEILVKSRLSLITNQPEQRSPCLPSPADPDPEITSSYTTCRDLTEPGAKTSI